MFDDKNCMDTKVIFGTKHIDWEDVLSLIENRSEGFAKTEKFYEACKQLKSAFENSFLVCTLYKNNTLVGICRALSDGVRQSVIYDLNIAQEYQNKGFGSMLMENILSKLPNGPIILFAVPGKEKYYTKFGFHFLRTGMGKFPDTEKRVRAGFI